MSTLFTDEELQLSTHNQNVLEQDPSLDDPSSPVDGSQTTPLMELAPIEVEVEEARQQNEAMANINDPTNTRDLIMHENQLINDRMTWMLVIQGFLFAGLGFVWENHGAVIYVFCAVGLLTALSMQQILWHGAGAIRNLEKDFEWDSYYMELKEYGVLYGNCNVPPEFTWGWEDEPKLGQWVAEQRREREEGKLDPKKKIRLYVLDFWSTNPAPAVLGASSSPTSSLQIARRKEATGLIIGAIQNNLCLYLYPWFFMPFVFMGGWIALLIINKQEGDDDSAISIKVLTDDERY